MNAKRLSAIFCAGSFFVGVHVEEHVTLDDRTAPVARIDGDGLDDLASSDLCLGPSKALAACAFWDIEETCCPAGCAARSGPNWSKADAILRGCMRGLGCSDSETSGATVFMKCHCNKK